MCVCERERECVCVCVCVCVCDVALFSEYHDIIISYSKVWVNL